MDFDSFSCELCILQRPETVNHLFFLCNFTKACWNTIGVTYVPTRTIWNIIAQIKAKLGVPFFMEIIILMAWSIWKTRNNWMFNNVDPSPHLCRGKFISEFTDLLHRGRTRLLQQMEMWLHHLLFVFSSTFLFRPHPLVFFELFS